MNRLSSSVAIGLVLLSAGVALAGEIAYVVPAYSAEKISVTAEKVFLKGDKIWFKLQVMNGTDRVMIFDKEQIQAKLPDGRVMNRARSAFLFGAQAKPTTVMPGTSQPLAIEYVIGKAPVPVTLSFAKGFVLDNKAIALPDFTVTPAGG